jgi:hypothetical protein
MEFLLPLLGGALGAAIINGVFAFFKLKHDKRVEHDQWLIDHQLNLRRSSRFDKNGGTVGLLCIQNRFLESSE